MCPYQCQGMIRMYLVLIFGTSGYDFTVFWSRFPGKYCWKQTTVMRLNVHIPKKTATFFLFPMCCTIFFQPQRKKVYHVFQYFPKVMQMKFNKIRKFREFSTKMNKIHFERKFEKVSSKIRKLNILLIQKIRLTADPIHSLQVFENKFEISWCTCFECL